MGCEFEKGGGGQEAVGLEIHADSKGGGDCFWGWGRG